MTNISVLLVGIHASDNSLEMSSNYLKTNKLVPCVIYPTPHIQPDKPSTIDPGPRVKVAFLLIDSFLFGWHERSSMGLWNIWVHQNIAGTWPQRVLRTLLAKWGLHRLLLQRQNHQALGGGHWVSICLVKIWQRICLPWWSLLKISLTSIVGVRTPC